MGSSPCRRGRTGCSCSRRPPWRHCPHLRARREEAVEVSPADANHVDDANVRQHALSGPPVDRRGADPDQLRDLAHGEELLDAAPKIWQQIGSKISRKACDSL